MTQEEKLRYLNECIYELKVHGIARTQGEVADLLGLNAATLSSAKSGKSEYLSDSLIYRLRAFMSGHPEIKLKTFSNSQPQTPTQGVFIPVETIELYTNLTARLTALQGFWKGMKMMEKGTNQKGLDTPLGMDAEKAVEGFWKNPDNICRLLDLLYLGREDEPPVGPPS